MRIRSSVHAGATGGMPDVPVTIREVVMAVEQHMESLRQKHAALENRIQAELSRPYYDSVAIQRLKFEKLRVKEQIDRYRQH